MDDLLAWDPAWDEKGGENQMTMDEADRRQCARRLHRQRELLPAVLNARLKQPKTLKYCSERPAQPRKLQLQLERERLNTSQKPIQSLKPAPPRCAVPLGLFW